MLGKFEIELLNDEVIDEIYENPAKFIISEVVKILYSDESTTKEKIDALDVFIKGWKRGNKFSL